MRSYSPPEELQDIWGGWRIVEARRYYQFGVEAVLSSFCQYLKSFDNRESSFEGFLTTIKKNCNELELCDSKVSLLTEVIIENKSLASFYEILISICKKEKISEEDIIEKIYLTGKKGGYSFSSKFAYYALILILLVFSKLPILEQLKSNNAKEFLLRPFDMRHSFLLVSKFLKSWMQLPFSDAISKIFTELSLKLHLGVAQDKWLQTGNFTFKYIKAEPIGFKLSKNGSIMFPGRTSNKILAYLEILIDLGLIKEGKDYYEITREGETFQHKYL